MESINQHTTLEVHDNDVIEHGYRNEPLQEFTKQGVVQMRLAFFFRFRILNAFSGSTSGCCSA